MRVALAGKGGAGKTTISATLARLLGASGTPVVAIDGDSNPNLAAALGIDRARAAEAGALPTRLISRRPGGAALTEPLDDVLERYAIPGPDGVRVVLMGMPAHAEEGCMCAAHATVGALLDDLGRREEIVTILDLEASPEHLARGTARFADVLLLVAEPYYRALETIRRMAALARELPIPTVAVVANKLRSEDDRETVAEYCASHGLELLAGVPWTEAAGNADRGERSLVDLAPDPAIDAVHALAKRLTGDPPGRAA